MANRKSILLDNFIKHKFHLYLKSDIWMQGFWMHSWFDEFLFSSRSVKTILMPEMIWNDILFSICNFPGNFVLPFWRKIFIVKIVVDSQRFTQEFYKFYKNRCLGKRVNIFQWKLRVKLRFVDFRLQTEKKDDLYNFSSWKTSSMLLQSLH